MKTLTILLLFLLSSLAFSQNSDWVQVNPNPQNDFYGIKFFDHNTGYVIGSGGVILKNTTGSNNWTVIDGNTINDLYGMYFFDVNHGYIVGAGGLIMYTSDGGANWTHIVADSRYALRSITFVNQNTGFLVGDHGELYKTTNGIYGWIPVSVTTKNLRSVFFIDSLKGFAVGDSGTFLKTSDSGNNWTVQNEGEGDLTCIYFRNPSTGYLTAKTPGFGSNTNAYSTTDGGDTWTMIPFFRIQGNWGSAKFTDQSTGFIAGDRNLVMRTQNGGTNWIEGGVSESTYLNDISTVDTLAFLCGTKGWIYEMSAGGFTKCLGGMKENISAISFIDENTGMIISDFTNLRTTNGGNKWGLQFFGWLSWEEGCAALAYDIKFFSPQSGFMIVKDQSCHGTPSEYHMVNSTNGGISWDGPRFFNDRNYGFAGISEAEGVTYLISFTPNGGIFRYSDSAWLQVYNANGLSLSGISFANANTGIALCGGSGNQGILLTSDGGENWSFTPMNNMNLVRSIQMLPSGVGYMGGDSSFFTRTTDFGATWTILSNNANNLYSQLQFVDNNTGWISGYLKNGYQYTRTLFYTPNGGANIVKLQSLENFIPTGMSFLNALTGFVCGDSGVVLKTTNGGLTFSNPTSSNVPDKFSLSQNYPNPFNPTTVIRFQVPAVGNGRDRSVKLIIYDVLGREVATLVNQQMQPGSYSVDWDALNYPSGVYFYQLSINNEQLATKRMVLIK